MNEIKAKPDATAKGSRGEIEWSQSDEAPARKLWKIEAGQIGARGKRDESAD